ncbi:DeoR/GlpR family DNA-binding transcription regulator [Alicyclobacillus tolerans]|nr:DeoR/GlpR family DNA-binding transcription regulator [Alicyclobacillus tolerans]
MEWVQQQGEMKIEQLRDRFNVSEVTLRRDLEILESQNLIRRIRGGAVPNTTPPLETLFQVKLESCTEQKREIALAAASMVEDGQVVMLSAGTTTTYIARELIRKKELTIVTTAVNIGAELAGYDHITLVMVGGIVRKGSYASVGHLADETLSTMNADFAFVGADGVDIQVGFTTPNLMEGRTDSMMLRAASKGIIVADSSKFGKVAFSPILRIQDPSMLITDRLASPDYVRQLRDAGCRVFIAGESQ